MPLVLASALEVVVVVAAGVLFLALVAAAVAVLVWSVAGFFSATHA